MQPGDVAAALSACTAGTVAPGVTLMQLCFACPDEDAARHALGNAMAGARGEARDRLAAVAALWAETPGAFAVIRAVIATEPAAAGPEATVARWAGAFDAAAAISPEASVALYSLGRADLLAAATAEIVDLLADMGVLGPGRAVLELGCGTGRFLAALSSRVGAITGLDISTAMLAEARRRTAGLCNVRLVNGSGHDLRPLPDAAFDLVLSVDAFPYLVDAGPTVVEGNLREAHRVLRPDGRLVIFNYSYRGDDPDRSDLQALADRLGFRILRAAERRLAHWDGALFDLARSLGATGP